MRGLAERTAWQTSGCGFPLGIGCRAGFLARREDTPNKSLQLTGHAKEGFARHYANFRVSRLLSFVFGLGDIVVDLFTIVPVFVGAVFIIVIATIIFRAGKGVAEWADNNGKPVLSERARVVAKRSETKGQGQLNSGVSVSTWYYVTFELPSVNRREFGIGGREYGMLSEGDEGTLTYQGTRYHGFERDRE